MPSAEQTVSMLLRGLVLPRRALPGPTTPALSAPATTELRLVQPLDDFSNLVSQHTARLPPVVCPSPAMAAESEDDFRAAVLRPVRVAASVLASIGLLHAAQGLTNADPGQLLYCEGPKRRPRMLILVSQLTTLAQNEVSPLSSQIAELCRKCRVRHFAVTDYAQWVFGCLSDGYGSAWLSPPIANESTQPTAVEALCYWMAQSHSAPQEEASPPAEPVPAPVEDSAAAPATAIPATLLLRRPSSSAAVRPPDPDENAKPRTSPRKRKAEEPKRREEPDGELSASPSKKRRAAAEESQEAEEAPATPTPSPRKRRVVDNDGPGPATPARRPSPSKVPLPESPSPRKRSPRKAAAALPPTQEKASAALPAESTSKLAAPERPNAFITPPTSARPTEPPPAPAPFSSPVRPPTGSRESPSPRRRGRKGADDDDVLVLPASPRKRKAGAGDDEQGSPRKRRTAAAALDEDDAPMLGDGSPRKTRAAAAPAVPDVTGSPRKRRTKAA